jgi:hypothetical protein
VIVIIEDSSFLSGIGPHSLPYPSHLRHYPPFDIEARYSRKRSTAWTGYKVHFTELCEDDEPHFIVEVVSTDATTVDGSVLQEIHEHEAAHDLLPHQHLMDMGYVDAEELAENQMRYQVDVVGPVMPDTCLRIQRSWTV